MTPRERLKQAFRGPHYLYRHAPVYWRESAAGLGGRVGVQRRLGDILHGYHPLEADWYRQIHGTLDGFISNFDREERLRGVDGIDGYVVDNKLVLHNILEAWNIQTPTLYGLCREGEWHWRPGGRDALRATLADKNPFALKPVRGKKGQGFRLCRDERDLVSPGPGVFIATSFIRQADYAAKIFDQSVNTIRVLMIRPQGREPSVLAAMQRIGTSRSAPVDNFSAGGVVAQVDVKSGSLGRALTIGSDNRVEFVDHHPETGAQITGVAVPEWPAIEALVTTLGRALPMLRYVGWDVAITGNGPVVVEGNSHPSLRFFQFYGSLVTDGRGQEFFAEFLPWVAASKTTRA